MALTPDAVLKLAEELIPQHRAMLDPNHHHGRIRRYLRGQHDLPYMPKKAKREYRILAERSITNWLPLISDTFSKMLWVDGYRASTASDNSQAWRYWQANKLDARQSIAHRGALEYGASYVLVLPGEPDPLIRPISPLRTLAFYEDDDDEWPVHALIFKGRRIDGATLYQLLEGGSVHLVAENRPGSGELEYIGEEVHNLPHVPLVRFRDRLDGEARGIIAPVINIQDRINESVFTLMIALQYASFRQRWATGLAIPVDDETGLPIEPFEAAVDRLWVSDNPEARFGDFPQTDVSGHLTTYQSAVKTLASISQISPLVFLGDLVNLAADALASVEATTTRKGGEFETNFGESWEQVFRLASLADGDIDGASDEESEVRWRESEARALASTVDALGKMAQMLMVPVEGLWDRIPGVTDGDVTRWREMAQRGDGLTALANALTANAEATTTASSFAPAPAPAPAPDSPNP
ncbi:phage portal protein [Actinopolymorpha pittospori]|uniref:Phage portal protein, SPP1 Gp6-like n=1 Tax=Actinopolymorpha pittospori TaxID=648752 RepID=A0A927MU61_9ACTN|nr:phage portal protein [Actinopolymorpha pittospori]MBE1606254.1 hypothetical protein [Actinopolymorpha pittospori]